MSLYGLPKSGSTSIAFRHSCVASSSRPWKLIVQPRNVCASAVGCTAMDARYGSIAPSRSPFIWSSYASRDSATARSTSSGVAIVSDGLGFLAEPHLPEHPLVAARRDEVVAHRVPRGTVEAVRDFVGRREHRAHDGAELFRGVRADPFRVQRIARSGALELLADFPVDPIAGQERG